MGIPTKIEVNKLSEDNYEIICIDELTGSATSINMPKNGYDALAAYFGKEALEKSSHENSGLHLQRVNNCLDKEHMRTIFEQSRATKADFESWYKFNYPNCC